MQNPPCLVSACLLGLCTRYDGNIKIHRQCVAELTGTICIPVCPEQLGGLPTPREAADIVGSDGSDVLSGTAAVATKTGIDRTAEFIRGAGQVLQIAQLQNVSRAFLKGRSPSCAVTGKIGVTAALLRSAGIKLIEF
jgi:uncharacterized protein YbbK (DUF523 family)